MVAVGQSTYIYYMWDHSDFISIEIMLVPIRTDCSAGCCAVSIRLFTLFRLRFGKRVIIWNVNVL